MIIDWVRLRLIIILDWVRFRLVRLISVVKIRHMMIISRVHHRINKRMVDYCLWLVGVLV